MCIRIINTNNDNNIINHTNNHTNNNNNKYIYIHIIYICVLFLHLGSVLLLEAK